MGCEPVESASTNIRLRRRQKHQDASIIVDLDELFDSSRDRMPMSTHCSHG